jgi:ubiquinone/menaquinone biosynthesis C-methylase UbiE
MLMGSSASATGPGPDGFWNTYSRYYDSVYHLMPYRKLLWDVFQALELEPGMRVLDAGCGTGNLEHFISGKDHPPVEIDAVDFSPGMLDRARRKCKQFDQVRFLQADLSDALPFPDGAFDRIVSVNVLYALPDRDRTIRELLRVLTPAGRMVLTSPLPNFSWGPLVADHFGRIQNIWGTGRKAARVLESLAVLSTTALGSLLLNVFVIYRRQAAGKYHSLAEPELRDLLETHREDGISDFMLGPAFADQNLFATATKAPAYATY